MHEAESARSRKCTKPRVHEAIIIIIWLNSFLSAFYEIIFWIHCFHLDPRVNDWPMMDSPLPTICICLLYAYFNKILMPKFMANRRPYDLRNILIAYNLFQTVFSAWIFYEVSINSCISKCRICTTSFIKIRRKTNCSSSKINLVFYCKHLHTK